VQYQAKARRRQRERGQDDRGPHEVEHSRGERAPAKHTMIIKSDDPPERRAQPGVKAGLTGERNRRMFDRQIAQIKRLADRQKADDQEDVYLTCRRREQLWVHAGFPSNRHYGGTGNVRQSVRWRFLLRACGTAFREGGEAGRHVAAGGRLSGSAVSENSWLYRPRRHGRSAFSREARSDMTTVLELAENQIERRTDWDWEKLD